jgi:DNA-binding response OmpR family regulator
VDDLLLAGIRVLLVEDSYDTREGIRVLLKQQGAEVTAVSSAEEALAAFREARPHVLLSDIGLAGDDGCQLLRSVRALGPEGGGDVPAAAITAYGASEDRVRALKAGFWDYVCKPVDTDLLVNVVASVVRSAASRPLWVAPMRATPVEATPPPPDQDAEELSRRSV